MRPSSRSLARPRWRRLTASRVRSEQGQLNCELRFTTFAEPGARRSPQSGKQERELGAIMQQALEVAVRVELFPKSVVDVHALVIQDDGGALAAVLSAASLALADAGVEMFDLVAACCCSVSRAQRSSPSDDS